MLPSNSFSAQTSSLHKIYLVGMPGCGKSTVGKILAERLQYTFLDLDTLIEEQEGLTVPQVFEQKGQDYFRQAEARALREATTREDKFILATGGGAPCFCENMDFMISQGMPVYLKVSAEELVNRLSELDLQARPLLRNKTTEELLHYLSETLAYREQFYGQTSYVVAAGKASALAIAQEIERLLPASGDRVDGSI